MLTPAALFTAVQRVAKACHEADDTAILARAVLQLMCEVERLDVNDRTLIGELRQTKSSFRRLKANGTGRKRPIARIKIKTR